MSDAIEADLAFLASLQRTDNEQRGNPPGVRTFDLDFDGFVGLRLGEHALHSWGVSVVLDPSATLPPSSADLLIDVLARVAAFSRKSYR